MSLAYQVLAKRIERFLIWVRAAFAFFIFILVP
jgi:hypothetical protein